MVIQQNSNLHPYDTWREREEACTNYEVYNVLVHNSFSIVDLLVFWCDLIDPYNNKSYLVEQELLGFQVFQVGRVFQGSLSERKWYLLVTVIEENSPLRQAITREAWVNHEELDIRSHLRMLPLPVIHARALPPPRPRELVGFETGGTSFPQKILPYGPESGNIRRGDCIMLMDESIVCVISKLDRFVPGWAGIAGVPGVPGRPGVPG